MSTVQTTKTPQNQLGSIFRYGKECLLNRWYPCLIATVFLIFLPRLFASLSFSRAATEIVTEIRGSNLNKGNILDLIESWYSGHLLEASLVNILALVATLVGVLTLAHLNVDYFEQRNPPRTLGSSMGAAFRVLLLKGVGVLIALAVIALPMSIFSLLRVILLCLLVMLPLELVAGHRGGIGSVINVIFLKYNAPTLAGKWPIFSNMMSIGGLALSLVFLLQVGLSYLLDLDIFFDLRSHWWISEISILGSPISRAHLIVHILELIGDSAIIMLALPFVASLRYHAQKSTFLIQT